MYDADLFTHIVTHTGELKARYGEVITMLESMEKAFKLVWDDEADVKALFPNVKITKSPTARNAVKGSQRLLTATRPEFKVPHDKNNPDIVDISEKIELLAAKMWQWSGRFGKGPIENDVTLSALLYDRIDIQISSTKDLVEYTKGGPLALHERAKDAAAKTPCLFKSLNPKHGYPEFDNLGLCGYYSRVEMTYNELINEFGKKKVLAASGLAPDGFNPYDTVIVCAWWDLEYHQIWIEGKSIALLQEKHKLPFIPIVVRIVEGSEMFDNLKDQYEPFLYTIIESGILSRQHLSITALATLVFAMGFTPILQEIIAPGFDVNSASKIDLSGPIGRMFTFAPNQAQMLPNKGIVDPAVSQLLQLTNQMGEQSTIFMQALGMPIGGQTSFSEVALLTQAGRLPLVSPQRMAGWAVGDAIKVALKWIKVDKIDLSNLSYKEIPDDLEIECLLEVSLPQDKLQMLNAANLAVQTGLASKRWSQENILHLGQTELMEKEMMAEKSLQAFFMAELQRQVAEYFANQQKQQQQQQQPPPEGGPLPVGPNAGAPPIAGGIPPELALQGNQPPEMLPGERQARKEGPAFLQAPTEEETLTGRLI